MVSQHIDLWTGKMVQIMVIKPLVLKNAPYASYSVRFKFPCIEAYALANYGRSVGVLFCSPTNLGN
jgi:hypothetical protein